jgi:hypothetical protein
MKEPDMSEHGEFPSPDDTIFVSEPSSCHDSYPGR